MSDYTKKVCTECDKIIHSEGDEERIRSLSGRIEYYHIACLDAYETRIKAEKKERGKGRPEKITPLLLTKIEHAFAANCNHTEACLYAGISTRTLTRYVEKHPEYSQRIDALRSNPRLISKLNISKQIKEGDISTSQFVLTRTDPDYKPKSEVQSEITGNVADALIAALGKGVNDDNNYGD